MFLIQKENMVYHCYVRSAVAGMAAGSAIKITRKLRVRQAQRGADAAAMHGGLRWHVCAAASRRNPTWTRTLTQHPAPGRSCSSSSKHNISSGEYKNQTPCFLKHMILKYKNQTHCFLNLRSMLLILRGFGPLGSRY